MKENLEIIGAAIAVIGGIPAVILPLYRFGRRLANGLDRIDEMHGQLHPNGGSSLRDVLDRNTADTALIRRSTAVQAEVVRIIACETGLFVMECDQKGLLVWASEKFCEVLGLSVDDALGSNWTNALHPADRDRVRREWFDSIQFRRSYISAARFRNVETGEEKNMRIELVQADGDKGEPSGWVAQFKTLI